MQLRYEGPGMKPEGLQRRLNAPSAGSVLLSGAGAGTQVPIPVFLRYRYQVRAFLHFLAQSVVLFAEHLLQQEGLRVLSHRNTL